MIIDWQKMDTAPKDGTDILATDGWSVAQVAWSKPVPWREGHWVVTEVGEVDRMDYHYYDQAVRWSPLPIQELQKFL